MPTYLGKSVAAFSCMRPGTIRILRAIERASMQASKALKVIGWNSSFLRFFQFGPLRTKYPTHPGRRACSTIWCLALAPSLFHMQLIAPPRLALNLDHWEACRIESNLKWQQATALDALLLLVAPLNHSSACLLHLAAPGTCRNGGFHVPRPLNLAPAVGVDGRPHARRGTCCEEAWQVVV